MFCALNGATRTPCRCSHRQIPAVSTLLPASEVVPATSSPPLIAAPAPPRPSRSRARRPGPSPPAAPPGPVHGRDGTRRARPRSRTPRSAAGRRPTSRPTGAVTAIRARRRPRRRRSGRPAEVPRLGTRAVAEERPHLGPSEVDVAPAEPDAERAGHGRLALAGVGARDGRRRRGARPAQARPRSPPATGATATVSSRGQPRRDQVGEVVEAGGRGAEPGVARRAVPDHGVERVRPPGSRAARAARRPRPRTAARPPRRRCSRRPTRPWPGPVPARPARTGPARRGGRAGRGRPPGRPGAAPGPSPATRAAVCGRRARPRCRRPPVPPGPPGAAAWPPWRRPRATPEPPRRAR